MKKIYLYLLIGAAAVVFTIVVVLTVISSKSQKSDQPGSTDARTTLTIWRPIDDNEIFKTIIEGFEEANPQIKINYVKKDLADYELESVNAMLAGKGPDIWSIPNYSLARHRDQLSSAPDGFLAAKKDQAKNPDINAKEFKDTFVKIAAEELIFDDKVYGFPFFVDTLALVINPEIFTNASQNFDSSSAEFKLLDNGPADWNEFTQLAKILTQKNGDTISRAGAALGTAGNITNSADILAALMMQNQTEMNSADQSQATFNLTKTKSSGEPFIPGKEALEFYTNFSDPNQSNYSWNDRLGNDLEIFSQGKVAMIFAYAGQLKKMVEGNPDLKYFLLPLPQIKGQTEAKDFASYWVETVPKSSSNSNGAWSFLRYALTAGLNQYLSQADRPSPLLATDAPEINQRTEAKNPFEFQQQTAVSWYRGPDPEKTTALFRQIIAAVKAGQSSQNALDSGASQISEIFRQK